MLTNTDNLVYYLDNINIEIEYDKLLTKDEVLKTSCNNIFVVFKRSDDKLEVINVVIKIGINQFLSFIPHLFSVPKYHNNKCFTEKYKLSFDSYLFNNVVGVSSNENICFYDITSKINKGEKK